MIFSVFRRWFSRSRSPNTQPADGTESMFIVPAVAPVAIPPTDCEGEDTEATEGNSVDPSSTIDSSGGESSCGASCGAMFP
ncbi:MAG: hypothetical protein F4Z01_05690 [Gammaproteobacteria bacterium]|nr:hypothetical protein [Gammaproteobacteria bacterium]MYF37785.1 hypothetical protein [Gammaproteobacteria bacterium]